MVTHLQNGKVAQNKAKQDLTSKVKGLKKQVKSKDQQLEELKGQLGELEKAYTNLTKKISNLKVEIKYIEEQWEKSAYEIKENILARAESSVPESTLVRLGYIATLWIGASKTSLLMKTMRLTQVLTLSTLQLILKLFFFMWGYLNIYFIHALVRAFETNLLPSSYLLHISPLLSCLSLISLREFTLISF